LSAPNNSTTALLEIRASAIANISLGAHDLGFGNRRQWCVARRGGENKFEDQNSNSRKTADGKWAMTNFFSPLRPPGVEKMEADRTVGRNQAWARGKGFQVANLRFEKQRVQVGD
jgi:hypothetical protein